MRVFDTIALLKRQATKATLGIGVRLAERHGPIHVKLFIFIRISLHGGDYSAIARAFCTDGHLGSISILEILRPRLLPFLAAKLRSKQYNYPLRARLALDDPL